MLQNIRLGGGFKGNKLSSKKFLPLHAKTLKGVPSTHRYIECISRELKQKKQKKLDVTIAKWETIENFNKYYNGKPKVKLSIMEMQDYSLDKLRTPLSSNF